MLNRRHMLGAAIAVCLVPREAAAQSSMPSAAQIQRRLDAAPAQRVRPQERVTVREFKRLPQLRRRAPSIDIQAINFGFDSAEVPYSQYRKVEQIADALHALRRRRPGSLILLEGHTDAVGSFGYNLRLSEQRAAALRRILVREFAVPSRMMETVGYGEEFLLVPTPHENWRNRRVTLRRIDDFIR